MFCRFWLRPKENWRGIWLSQRLKMSALHHIRPFDDIRLWDRDVTTPRAIRLAKQTGARLHSRVEDAIDGADVICTTTSALQTILPGDLLEPGMHVNLVGSSAADAREADDEVVARTRLFIDFRPSTMDEAGELLNAMPPGACPRIMSSEGSERCWSEIVSAAPAPTRSRSTNHCASLHKTLSPHATLFMQPSKNVVARLSRFRNSDARLT